MFKVDWLFKVYLPVDAGKDAHGIVQGLALTYFNGYTSYLSAEGGWSEGKHLSTHIEKVKVHEFIVSKDFPERNLKECLEHMQECVFRCSKEKAILMSKQPIETIYVERKDDV